MTTTTTLRTLGLAGVLGLSLCGGAGAENIRVAGNFPVDHSSSIAMETFKAEVEELTNGTLTVDLFPAMQLGGAGENVDQVRTGAILATWVGAAYLSRIVPELEAVSLPFVFPDRETAFDVMDGEVGKRLDEKLAEKGFVSLGWMELGSRHVTNNVRPIETMEDFEGLKIRLQPNETHIATFKAIGANPQAMDIAEVYSALQQGVLDGQENPYPIILTQNFDEVQQHLSDTSHFFDFIAIVANKDKFEGLSAEHQDAIRQAMATAVAEQRGMAAEADRKALEALKESMTFTPIPDETRAALQEATSGVVDEVKKRAGAEMVELVLEQAKQ